MSDFDLSDLMVGLLRAQAHRCKSPLSEVRINTEDKAKDDGCDGWDWEAGDCRGLARRRRDLLAT